jgi:hypothetical protein
MTDDEEKYWREFWQLPKEEQLRMVQQTIDEHPELWVKDPDGRCALKSRLLAAGQAGIA